MTITIDRSQAAPSAGVPMSSLFAMTAATTLAAGASLSGHLLFLLGLPLTLAGFALACASGRREAARRRGTCSALWLSLTMLSALAIVGPSTHGAVWDESARRAYAVLGVFLVGMLAGGDRDWQRRAITVAVVVGVSLHLVTPVGTPTPQIDVYSWTQTSVTALLNHIHPYTVVAPDVYDGRYDPGFTVSVYPYMPATLLAYAPFVAAFGDFRFALAACTPITVWLIHVIGQRLSLDRQLVGASSLAFLLHPDGPRMIESGWTEPLLVTAAAAFVVLALEEPNGFGQGAAFFLLPSLKQYFVAPIFMYLDRMRRVIGLRPLLAGAAAAAVTLLPFLIWNWHATLNGIVFQMRGPTVPRLGSTSLVALAATCCGVYPSRWTSVSAQFAIGALAWWSLKDRGLFGLLLASALSLCATFLVAWQAFVNYYYFVSALLVLAALVGAAEKAAA